MTRFFFSVFFVLVCGFLGAREPKVLIFTYSYNRPDFIEIQEKTFRKFLRDDYEFVVFNDAVDPLLKAKIEQTCEKLQIRCIEIPQEIHPMPYLERFEGESWNHPCVRNANVVQYSLNNVGFFHDGIVALFDSDLFLVRDFSIVDFMDGYHLSGLEQVRSKNNKRINYLWVGLSFIDMKNLPDANTLSYNCGKIDDINVDVGGYTHYYLRTHPDVKIRWLNQRIWPFSRCESCIANNTTPCLHNTEMLFSEGFDEHQIKFIHDNPIGCEFYMNNCFMHYRAGTNWDYQSQEYHNHKTRILNEYIDSILISNE